MIRMAVALLIVGIDHHHVRTLGADDGRETLHRLSEGGGGEGVRRRRVLCVGHAGIPVAQPDHLVVTDDLGRSIQLLPPQFRQALSRLRSVDCRVENAAFLPAGAADQHRAHSFVRVTRHRGGAFGGLVVGVCVNREQPQGFTGPAREGHLVRGFTP